MIIGVVFLAIGLYMRYFSQLIEVHDSRKKAIDSMGLKSASGCLSILPIVIGILFLVGSCSMNY